VMASVRRLFEKHGVALEAEPSVSRNVP
jgi:hypothetical protein